MLPNAEIKKAEIHDYLMILKKRLWIVVVFALIGGLVSVYQALDAEKTYSTADVNCHPPKLTVLVPRL